MSEFVRVPRRAVEEAIEHLTASWSSCDAANPLRDALEAAPTAPPASPGPEPLTEHERRWLDSMMRDPDPQANDIRRRDVALIRRLAAIADHYRNQCAQGKEGDRG